MQHIIEPTIKISLTKPKLIVLKKDMKNPWHNRFPCILIIFSYASSIFFIGMSKKLFPSTNIHFLHVSLTQPYFIYQKI